MKRAVALLLVLTMVFAVQGAPENEKATNIRDSECYDCHKAGGGGVGPVLQFVFRIFMAEAPDLEPGANTTLTFDIRNWWTAELLGFTGYIDISDAPALSFEANKEPVTGQKEGQLAEYEPASYYQGEERTTRLTADVATGGTDLNFTLIPSEDSDADLILRIWGPDQDPDTDPPIERDVGGPGEKEVFFANGDPILGGPYTIEVAETPNAIASPTPDLESVSFELHWALSYQFKAGATQRTGASLDILDGQTPESPQSTQVSWTVNVIEEITEQQRIHVYMESAAYYDHPPQFRAVDEWLYWQEVDYVINPQDDGTLAIQRVSPQGDLVTEFIVGEQVIEVAPAEESPDLTVEEDPPYDIASEVIGYVAAFLLVISLLTGGAFGNWSRRLQNWMIYRRARTRVNFHNVISYGLILAATAHMVLFLVEPKYPWSVGFFLGSVSILGMYLSGVTGAYQRVMVRSMGHEAWRWLHYLSFVFAFAGAAGHILLDGIHFADFQAMVGWQDPVAPVLEQVIPINDTAPAAPPP